MATERYLLPILLMAIASCGGSTPGTNVDLSALKVGEEVYKQYCLACHQMDGSGVPGLYPPLTRTEWVAGDRDRLIEVVLTGLSGTIEVNGEIYNQEMAASEFLTDEEIAAVLTYVRIEFGKSGSEVTEGDVALVRAKLKPSDP